MAELRLKFALITQQLTDTNELCLGELLRVPELSTVASSHDSAWRALVYLAEKFFPDLHPSHLWQRPVGESPVEPFEIALEVEPSQRQSSAGAWREPAHLHFHGVRWKRPNGPWLAYVPVLHASAMADTPEALHTSLDRELRFAIQRAASQPLEGVTLKSLAMLQRVESVAVETVEIPVDVKSPKARLKAGTAESEEKSVLQTAATDLTRPEPPKAYELDDAVQKIAEALTGRGARSVLLVGPSGVGKSAAVGELVRSRDALGLGDRPFWGTSGSRLVMGAIGFGAWQERCHKLCREAHHTRSVVYLGNLIELLEVGKSESNSIGIAGQLRGYMARGELLAIAECTPEQLSILEREDPHLLAAFRQVVMEEPPARTLRTILEKVAAELTAGDARKRGKDFERIPVLARGALQEVERLHRRYASYSAFPGRPIRFLRNLLRDAEGRGFEADATCTAADVTGAFARETGLPMLLLSEEVPLDVEETRGWFRTRVVAQEEAVDRVVDVLATVKAALNRPRRPIASLLFIGPTGVGKTEMAKTLAEFFFSDRARLARFDMSEFATPLAVKCLIGGLGASEGLLTAKVREQPFSVLLLDEIEKSHASFFDLLLQVLGDGRLTDAAGRVADFSNAVVIMTSNLGTQNFDRRSFGIKETRKADPGTHFVEEVRQFMRPELFNRIDRIIPFCPLDADAIAKVARRELELVARRDGVRLRDMTLDIAPAAIDRLAANGFDPAYGARPLKRTIERELLSPLADALNRYTEDIPLKATVKTDGPSLQVTVRAADARPSAGPRTLGPVIAQRAPELRRTLQRLTRSGMVLQIQNEVDQLNRLIDRVLLKHKSDHAMLQPWRDRLKRVRGPADEVAKLLEDAIAIEEAALLTFYEQREDPPQPREWLADLAALEKRLSAVLLSLHTLRFARPDHITLGIFSPTPARAMELARAYYALARQREFDVQLAWFKQDGRAIVRYRADSAKAFFGGTDPNPLGLALEMNGPCAAPLLEAEAGWHVFRQKGDKITFCQVLAGHDPLGSYIPPDVAALIKGPNAAPRREFNMETKTVSDALVAHEDPWSRLDAVVRLLIERGLERRILEPLDEEAEH